MAEASIPVVVKESPKAAAAKLSERVAILAAALKFSSVYEFTKVGASPVWSKDPGLLPHTWASVATCEAVSKLRVKAPVNRAYALTAAANSKYSVDLPFGVTVLLGKSGSGKTRFAFDHLFTSAQGRGEDPLYIKMHEPGDEDRLARIAKPDNYDIPDFEMFMANTLATALFVGERDLIIIDSLRYLFYSSSGGATGKGGVNMSLFMDLTHLDVLATRLRKRVVVVINPMTDDPTAFDFYIEAAIGAVSGVIVMDTPTSARVTNRYAATRDLVSMHVPSRSANDQVAQVRSGAKSDEIGSTVRGNVSVNATIFGRNK